MLLATLTGHDKGINDAVFSPDGAHIATASGDWTTRIWNDDPAADAFTAACTGLADKT